MAKILIAEDDTFLARAYEAKFKRAGLTFKITSNGQECLDSLDSFEPDVLVLDLLMPVKDGYAVIKEVKANPKWSALPIIVASNLGQKEDIDRCLALGVSDFFVKSDNSLQQLIQLIESKVKSFG